MSGPLQGVRVVEFSEIIAGPLAGMQLSDLGADVIKIEPPWGDPWRHQSADVFGEARPFIAFNRGKRSVTVDLRTDIGRSAMERLAATADVVITNHRPDVPGRRGFDYPTLSASNSRLIYCEVTAFGSEGPDSSLPGYDLIMQAYTGMLASEGKVVDGRLQEITSSPLIDMATGYSATASIAAALFARERDGKGQKIELSLLANGLLMQVQPLTRLVDYPSPAQEWVDSELEMLRQSGMSGQELHSVYDTLRPASASAIYYRTYVTADSVIAVGCLSDPLRKRLSDVLGLDDPRFEEGFDIADPVYAEIAEELSRRAEQRFLEETAKTWITTLREAGVPVAAVGFIEEMTRNAQAVANGLLIEQEHPVVGTVRTVGPTVRMSGTPLEAVLPSPALGQHTDEVMLEIGYDAATIADMRSTGAFG